MSFWEMGGYAAYVWPSFGGAAVILIALLLISVRTLRARERTLRALEASRAEGTVVDSGAGEGSR